MGTRADFYVKNIDGLEWLGSIAWDGYPGGIDRPVLAATTEPEFRTALTAFFDGRDDVTLPERGWPWPWNDSNTSDYGYVFFDGVGVVHRSFGDGTLISLADADGREELAPVTFDYPDMSARKNVRLDGGSGLIFITS